MARFLEVSGGHYINCDYVVEIDRSDNGRYLLTMHDGKRIWVGKSLISEIFGANDIKAIIPVQGMEIHYLEENKRTSEPVKFIALTESGCVRAADVGDLYINFMDEGQRFDGITMDGVDLGWVDKGIRIKEEKAKHEQ